MPRGRVLRLIVDADATIIWSANDWANTIETEATHISALKLWFADLSTQDYPEGTVIEFSFRSKDPQATEGIKYSVTVQPYVISDT